MVDNEMLQAFSQMIDDKLASIRLDMKTMDEKLTSEIQGVKVLLDLEIRRDIKLLAEGHETILDHLPDTDEVEAMEARLSAVEAVIRKHSKDIQALKKAQ